MMRTVSLRRRMVGTGMLVVALVLIALDAIVFLNVRGHLLGNLEDLLDDRAQLAQAFAPTFTAEELARLAGSEIQVSVLDPDGNEIHRGPDGENRDPPQELAPELVRRVKLPTGTTVQLVASPAGVNQILGRLLLGQVVGTAIGVALAALLLMRASRLALRPVDTVVATARQIRAGHTTERLNPDRTDTELGRMALAFDEMLDALEAALTDARASEEATRRFLAEAAHQLRTPLAGIQASAEALPAAHTRAERDELLANLARETTRAGRRVTALLRMARLHQGTEPVRRRCDLVALCEGEVERTRGLAHHLDIGWNATGPIPHLDLDPTAIREAVANVLDNARRHAVAKISLTLSSTAESLHIRVSDDGPGLPSDDIDAAFDRFVSLDGHGGSGLGLTITRGIARNHGGDATYEGGAFVIRLPLTEPDHRNRRDLARS